MVRLNVKRGDQPLFLFETTTQQATEQIIAELAELYNEMLR